MSLDVGDKTIGVAVSDLLGFTAQGITTIMRKSLNYDLSELKKIISEYEVEEIIIGLPKNMNGSIGPRAEIVKTFAENLTQTISLKIIFWDERLSTVAANRTLLEADLSRKKRKAVIDKMAAVYILQGYLNSKQ
jgi:putative Holliday junction resolvase